MSRYKRAYKFKHRSKKPRGNHIPLWVYFALLGVCSFFSFVVYMVWSQKAYEVNPQTLCRTDGIVPQHIIIFVDSTDSFLKQTVDRIKNEIIQTQKSIDQYGKLTIAAFDTARRIKPKVLFSKCMPKRVEDTNNFNDSLVRVEAEWKRDFGNELFEKLVSLERLPEAKNTPLLEAIVMMTQRLDFNNHIPHRQLILISDMLHFTDQFSLYRRNPDIAKLPHEYRVSNRVQNRNFDVDILFIPRRKVRHYQTEKLFNFWEAYFSAFDLGSFNIKIIQ